MSLEHCGGVFSGKFIVGGLELGKQWGLGCSRNVILFAMVCCDVFNF